MSGTELLVRIHAETSHVKLLDGAKAKWEIRLQDAVVTPVSVETSPINRSCGESLFGSGHCDRNIANKSFWSLLSCKVALRVEG